MKIAIANGRETENRKIMDRFKLMTTDIMIIHTIEWPIQFIFTNEIANILLLSFLNISNGVRG
jgi:hypothetical protein